MAIAYYVDDDIGMKPTLAGLHRLGIEVDPCDAFGMRGAEDGQHLAFAHAIGRTLVTANRRDFARIHGEWMASGETHSGIILADQRTSIGNQIRGLARIHAECTADHLVNQLYWLENWL